MKDVITLVSRVTMYIHNRKWIHSWLRKMPGWREIFRPTKTQFDANLIALKSFHNLRQHLETFVTSSAYKRQLKNENIKKSNKLFLMASFRIIV